MSLSFTVSRPLAPPAAPIFDPGAMVRFGGFLVLATLLGGIGLHEAGCLTAKLAAVLPMAACGGGALASLGVLVHCLRELRA